MRPPSADAPARRARRAARLVRACATALEPRPRDGAPGAKTTTEGKEQTKKEELFEARALASAKTRVSAATRFYSSGVSASSASHERRPHASHARVAVAVAAVAAVAVVLFSFFVSRVGRIPADAERVRVPDVEAYRSGYPGYGLRLPSFPACKRHSRATEDAIASLRLALARTRANEDALRRRSSSYQRESPRARAGTIAPVVLY